MKKIYLFLVLPFLTVQFVTAQTSRPEVFNFLELAKWDAAHPRATTSPKESNELNRFGHPSFPLPQGANVKMQSISNTPTPNSPLSASPVPIQNFGAYVDPYQYIPPDTHGCVGLNHVVTYTNDWFMVQSKTTGAIISQMNAFTFAGGGNASGDTYIEFDPVSNRFIATSFTFPPSGANQVTVCISQTPDPTGAWFRYNFIPATASAVFWDHPCMGFDGRFVVVNGNEFNLALNAFLGTGLVVIDKATLYAGLPITNGVNMQTLEALGAPGGYGNCPVTVYGTNPSTDFNIIQSWNGTSIRLTKVTGNLPNLVWNIGAAVFPSVPAASAWQTFSNNQNLAQQIGETRKINASDEISSAEMINGNIWCVHSIGFPVTGALTNLATQWWKISPAGTVIQRGVIGANTGEYRWYPSIAVNGNESVVIGYTQSTTTSSVSAAYSTRSCNTPANTTDNEYIYKTGIAVYWKDYGGGSCRWGDYSHTSLDPVDGTIWTIQEYAAARVGTGDNASRYGLWWAQVDACPAIRRDATISAIIEPRPITYCNFPIIPQVTIRNNGLDTIQSVQVGEILDGSNIGIQTFSNLNLLPAASLTVTLATPLNPVSPPFTHTFKAYTLLPNGLSDQRPSNDTASVTFIVAPTLPLPNLEGFESTTFPPPGGWAIDNPDGGLTWQRTTTSVRTGVGAMTLAAYQYTTNGAIDRLKSPKLDITALDSVKISFDVSYAPYSGGAANVDTLEIEYSLDCGQTWLPSGYKKWGFGFPGALGTNPPQAGEWFPASAADWRNDKLAIPICGIATPSMMIGVKWINNYGNDVYIDNLNIVGVNTFVRNAGIVDISSPFGTLCANTFTPVVTIGNFGSAILTSAIISYQIDGGALTTFNYTGSLAKCSTQVVTLAPVTSTPGSHIFKVYTSLPNGGTDQYTFNDTLSKPFSISAIVTAPLVEGFEGPLFPPNGWNVSNPDNLLTWERTTLAGSKSSASMVIRNFNYPVANTVDNFFSPIVTNTASIDSFFVSWDYAYSPGFQYPGATAFPLDTLELKVTTDCGKTFTTIWKKWGEDLSTLPDPTGMNNPNNSAYVPQQPVEWKNARIYLTPIVGAQNFQVYFVAKSNKQNNLYIDNININSKTLPARLKNQGYLIYPVPFTTSFKIHHYLPPVDLQSVGVYNSIGQLVWKKNLNGQGNTEEFVDLRNMAAGVYEVKLTYSNKTVVERVVKTQ